MNILRLFRRKAANGKAAALLMVSCLILVPGLIVAGCGSGDFLGLEDYQRDFGAVAIALLADGQDSGNNQQVGEPLPGPAGLSCWDLNGNGVTDPEEDVNGDGSVDALDCRGADGAPGRDGADGTDGADGSNGPALQALHCWDINGNGIADPEEDMNDDGSFDALDCRGADGADGINGSSGGSGPGGPAGADGQDGAAGLSCWDRNGNGTGDPEEDINEDGFFDSLDCRGATGRDGGDGADGRDGVDGVDGQVGAAGLSCWDLNGNGTGDPEEDNRLFTASVSTSNPPKF